MPDRTLYQRAFKARFGLPDLDWDLIFDELDERPATWLPFLDEWLPDLARRLEPDSTLAHEGNVRCIYNSRACSKPLPEIANRIRQQVYAHLVDDPGYLEWPTVVIHIGAEERYYDYVSITDPREGEIHASSGCMIGSGYLHIVMNATPPWDVEPLLAHEFVHLALFRLPTPLWLEEGLAQLIPDVVLNWSAFRIDRELVQRHREHWTSETIQSFWHGSAFSHPETSELAYSLADILTRNIARDHGTALRDFVASSNDSDAGDEAAGKCLGRPLAEIAAGFLGSGDWGPTNPARDSER